MLFSLHATPFAGGADADDNTREGDSPLRCEGGVATLNMMDARVISSV